MDIAIIGTGRVALALAKGWLKVGHQIHFGSRDPSSDKVSQSLAKLTGNFTVSRSADAAKKASIVVLAIPWTGVEQTLNQLGELQGKILIDATNPLGGEGLLLGHRTSAAEQIQAWVKEANVIKAFNCTGSGNMENPDYQGQAVSLFIAGDDPEAKSTVSQLARDLGFEVIDTGELKLARALEPLAQLWVHLAYQRGMGFDIAFKLLQR